MTLRNILIASNLVLAAANFLAVPFLNGDLFNVAVGFFDLFVAGFVFGVWQGE